MYEEQYQKYKNTLDWLERFDMRNYQSRTGRNHYDCKTQIEDIENHLAVKWINEKVIFDNSMAGITNINDFFKLLQLATKKGVKIEDISRKWLNSENMEKMNEMYRLTRSNSIKLAMRKTNKNIGRPLKSDTVQKAIKMYLTGEYTGEEIAEKQGISRSTLYRYLKEYNIK